MLNVMTPPSAAIRCHASSGATIRKYNKAIPTALCVAMFFQSFK